MSITTERLTRVRYVTAILVAILAALVLARAFPAAGQERDALRQWIHDNAKECCPHDRCFPVTAAPARPFWQVEGFKSAVPLGGERRWPFARTYGCAYAGSADTIRCLFVPTPEQS